MLREFRWIIFRCPFRLNRPPPQPWKTIEFVKSKDPNNQCLWIESIYIEFVYTVAKCALSSLQNIISLFYKMHRIKWFSPWRKRTIKNQPEHCLVDPLLYDDKFIENYFRCNIRQNLKEAVIIENKVNEILYDWNKFKQIDWHPEIFFESYD